MKRTVVASIVSVGVALAGVPIGAAAQTTTADSVTGTATSVCFRSTPVVGCFLQHTINVSVTSGPIGENPSGTLVIEGLAGPALIRTELRVTCLSVSNHVAIVGVAGTVVERPFLFTLIGLVRIVDAGGPGSRADTVEIATQATEFQGEPMPPGPTTCSTYPGPFPPSSFFMNFTNASGNLTVIDAQPLPTSKDQCKHGGWRSYPGFKNQGDCVSFVATGGKNPPG